VRGDEAYLQEDVEGEGRGLPVLLRKGRLANAVKTMTPCKKGGREAFLILTSSEKRKKRGGSERSISCFYLEKRKITLGTWEQLPEEQGKNVGFTSDSGRREVRGT